MKNPLVSVIIPAYNAEKVLDRCLKSVCGQQVTDIEIIVINDGSQDRTAEILSRWAQLDPRITAVTQSQQGVSAARNNGIRLSRGEFIRFVDSDDELPENGISDLLSVMQSYPSDIAIAGFYKVVGTNAMERNALHRDALLSIAEYLNLLNTWSNSFFCGALWNKLFRRALIEKGHCRFHGNLTLGEDFDFCNQYLTQCQSVALSTKFVYRYSCNPTGLTFKHAGNCLKHPFHSINMKWIMYKSLKALYVHHHLWKKYRFTLWLYLFKTTLSN